MKKTLLALSAILSLAIAAAIPMQAQSVNLRVSVPFEFSIDGKLMPAGDYSIKDDSITGLLKVERTDGTGSAVMAVSFSAGQDKAESVGSRAIFARYDNRYFLRQVIDSGRQSNRQLEANKAEREAKTAAVRTESVTLLAKR